MGNQPTPADTDAAMASFLALACDYSTRWEDGVDTVLEDGTIVPATRPRQAPRAIHHPLACLTPPVNPVPVTRDPKPRRTASAGSIRALARDSELRAHHAAKRDADARGVADDYSVADAADAARARVMVSPW